jgi:hypothetical protein
LSFEPQLKAISGLCIPQSTPILDLFVVKKSAPAHEEQAQMIQLQSV